ncbi:uncharacterized protein LOC117315209 [Pecten maximus]|uniref:uncharacterized protein LOC117315209 n=1 Tax=Pecten maximus TaxID=6579 RepID=UPI0014582AB6|nr:uncharacterized protein LOC117315209 [Pecten maximus]
MIYVHCICLKLACTDTNKDLNKIKDAEVEVTQLWKVFDNSPKKLSVYLKIQQEMKAVYLEARISNKISRRLKKACATRWLSFDKAIDAVCFDLPAILQTLRQLKGDPACYGLLKKFSKAKKIGTLYILHAVLPILSKLSKAFQQGTINFSTVEPCISHTKDQLLELAKENAINAPVKKLLEDTKDGILSTTEIRCSENDVQYLQKLLQDYIKSLIENINNRFKNASPILNAMQVFDCTAIPPKNHPEFQSYGNTHISLLASHFFPESMENQAQLHAEFSALKYAMQDWLLPENVKAWNISPTEWALQRLCSQRYAFVAHFPLMCKVIEALMVIPVSNAWPERGASRLKLIKTRLRSTMKGDMLNSLMQIALNGPKVGSPECKALIASSVHTWLSAKQRKKIPKPPHTAQLEKTFIPVQADMHSLVPEDITDAECALQESPPTVHELVNAAAAKFGLQDDSESDGSDYFSGESESEFE